MYVGPDRSAAWHMGISGAPVSLAILLTSPPQLLAPLSLEAPMGPCASGRSVNSGSRTATKTQTTPANGAQLPRALAAWTVVTRARRGTRTRSPTELKVATVAKAGRPAMPTEALAQRMARVTITSHRPRSPATHVRGVGVGKARRKGTDTGTMESDTASRRTHRLMAGGSPPPPTITADQMHPLPPEAGVVNTDSSPTTVSSTPMQSREGIRDRGTAAPTATQQQQTLWRTRLLLLRRPPAHPTLRLGPPRTDLPEAVLQQCLPPLLPLPLPPRTDT
mmetsp:Transcript_153291/g.267906  ORF Transcript_153291/g.267906 Transcript_153291/m.267906 type:complete len:278 (-) Transcript_153291:1359-2192(-)